MLSNELMEAIDLDSMSDEEMEAFMEAHPDVLDYVLEGMDVDVVMSLLEKGSPDVKRKNGRFDGSSGGNPGNNPFATQPLHDTSAAGTGGGKPNGRVKTGQIPQGGCKCHNYVCKCKRKDGKMVTINMKSYYKSGRKAKYMKLWRQKHEPVHSKANKKGIGPRP